MKRWVVVTKRADFDAIARNLSISPMLARIARNRDMETEDQIRKFLTGDLTQLYDPMLLKDMDVAVSLVKAMIEGGGRICVVGDYDVDGVCSTYILVKTLQAAGANVSWMLPDRVKDGYGLNRRLIDRANEDKVAMILTCDNGIAALDAIDHAKELGMCVIVTDHHEPQEQLPAADAIVNPKQPGCTYPYREICGAVVAYKFVQILCRKMQLEMPGDLLEFAAFATVCDVMPLLDENHIIVKYGIEKMKTTTNIGLNALIDVTGQDRSKLGYHALGFVLGPCVNATGRLDLAEQALQLFLSDNREDAVRLAQSLKELNVTRKAITDSATKEAIRIVTEGDDYNPVMAEDPVLVIFLPDCHESIAGIVAGKVREHFYKPAIVLTRPGAEGTAETEGTGETVSLAAEGTTEPMEADTDEKPAEGSVKGSGRSIEAYNMFEALQKESDLLLKFGGHKMAAGMSLKEEDIKTLRKSLNEHAGLSEDDLTEKVKIDIPMPVSYVTEAFTKELDLLRPFGNGNPTPLFAQKGLKIKEVRVQGKDVHNSVKVYFEGEQAYGFRYCDADAFAQEYHAGDTVSIVYTPKINEFNGKRSIQLDIKEIKPDT